MSTGKGDSCQYTNAPEFTVETASNLGISLPQAYQFREPMAALARGIRQREEGDFCILPFCHTVEAEALGGRITYGDGTFPPRGGAYLTDQLEDLLQLPHMDLTQGRIHQVLEACKELCLEGESVVLELSSPLTIVQTLMDVTLIFRAMRKTPDLLWEVLNRLGRDLMRYAQEALASGVTLISLADPLGGESVLGPALTRQMVQSFLAPYLREFQEITRGRALILLCPKLTRSLLGAHEAVRRKYPLRKVLGEEFGGTLTYGQGCLAAVGKISIVGQRCIQRAGTPLQDGILEELVLET